MLHTKNAVCRYNTEAGSEIVGPEFGQVVIAGIIDSIQRMGGIRTKIISGRLRIETVKRAYRKEGR